MKTKKKTIFTLALAGLMALSLISASAVDVEKDKGSITVTIQSQSGDCVEGVEVSIYQVGKGRVEDHNLYFDVVQPLQPAQPLALDEEEQEVELSRLTAQQNQDAAQTLYDRIQELPAGTVAALTKKDRMKIIALLDQKNAFSFQRTKGQSRPTQNQPLLRSITSAPQ